MKQLRELIGVSFKDLEKALWTAMVQEFSKVLSAVLETVDEVLLEARDKNRFVSRDIRSRTVDTLLGMDVSFNRREYRDTETGKPIYLLDEVMGLQSRERLSPGLKASMLTQAVTTASYRKAAESIKRLLGFPTVSHESIRQTVLDVGSAVEEEQMRQLENPQGKRKPAIVFLEVDGMHVSLQQEKKRSIEEKVLTMHTGWEPRYPGSKDYSLLEVEQFRMNQGDFWDPASRYVYSHCVITEDTFVIINGDRDKWIRKGIDYFPNAMYQVDRFHLNRDLRYLFRSDPKRLKALYDALDCGDVTGATFIAKLAEAKATLTDGKRRDKAKRLLSDLATIPEATVDYRIRLRARGVSTKGLRGLGAAESQIDRLSDRMKGRGQSWRPEGEAAMMELLCARNTGRFDAIVSNIETWYETKQPSVIALKQAVKQAARSALRSTISIPIGGTPIRSAGTSASGGLSDLFHRLNESGLLLGN